MAEGSMIAILLFKSAPVLKADVLAAKIRELYPIAGAKIDVTARDKTLLITLGEDVLTVMVMDSPVPAGSLDRALDGQMTWPDAKSVLSAHRHHIIVGTLKSGTDKAERISVAKSLAVVCAALAGVTDCLGVYWASSETVSEPKAFVAECVQAFGDKRAPFFWTRLYLFRGEERGGKIPVGCVTRGLADLVGREIEFEPALLPPAIVGERVLGAAHLLLFGAKEIKDGDTIGVSANEHIRVMRADVGNLSRQPIVGLSYESASGTW